MDQAGLNTEGRRTVTRAEFQHIECNRCGACCEVVWQPAPLFMAILLGRNVVPGEILSWWSDLQPIEATASNADDRSGRLQRYRCLRFAREGDGTGVCTQYESRPVPCRTFPDGSPVHAVGFEACSWNVTIRDEDIV